MEDLTTATWYQVLAASVVAPVVTRSLPFTFQRNWAALRYKRPATSVALLALVSIIFLSPVRDADNGFTQHSIVNAAAPNANSAEDGILIYSSIGDATPTLTVIVVPVTAVIASATPDDGSVERGYALPETLPSWSHVNVTPPSAIVTVFDVVKVWVPISRTISPVTGL